MHLDDQTWEVHWSKLLLYEQLVKDFHSTAGPSCHPSGGVSLTGHLHLRDKRVSFPLNQLTSLLHVWSLFCWDFFVYLMCFSLQSQGQLLFHPSEKKWGHPQHHGTLPAPLYLVSIFLMFSVMHNIGLFSQHLKASIIDYLYAVSISSPKTP